MDFSLSEEQQLTRDSVRRFAKAEMAPLVMEAEETETFPKELFQKWGELGIIGARYPAKDGGGDMDKITDCLIRE